MAGLFTQQAMKEQLKARVAIDGPTGSGKTYTALQWAVILAGGPMSEGGKPIGLVDSENRSAAYYAPTPGVKVARVRPWEAPYEFFHLPIRPPYDPRDLARIIDAAEDDLGEDGVLVIDSLTHYWNGEGGTLQIVDDTGRGNNFAGWKEGTPAQRMLVDRIIHAPFHVITTMRSKMEYVLEETTNTRGNVVKAPKKVGMAPEQRAGIEYEFTIVADMDLNNDLVIGKTRCDLLPPGTVFHKGRSFEAAETFAGWLDAGVIRITEHEALLITGLFNSIPKGPAGNDPRADAKQAFVAIYGPPANLLSDKVEEAMAWIRSVVDTYTNPKPDAAVQAQFGTEPPPSPVLEPQGEAAQDLITSNGTSDGEEPALEPMSFDHGPGDDVPHPADTPSDAEQAAVSGGRARGRK